ncbi:MAG: 50S ribosomal protein L6, partial [Bdellovibrionaceae bacterium]|nr:50S ribosomal protein L6 [Pseudobdellovibrionaceae bacterium]
MSRIGNAPITIPDKVKVTLADRNLQVEGPKGKLAMRLPPRVQADVADKTLKFTRKGNTPKDRAQHGLARALANNMVNGALGGFQKRLEINGVGFKAAVQGKVLNLSLGKSHPINFKIPEGISIKVEDNTKILVEGADRQTVGQVAANIRRLLTRPEPYKGKGVKYIRRNHPCSKEGKTAPKQVTP